jgi:succinyl-CoA synthetase beta subunit
VKLFEYQAKKLFAGAGIPVPRSEMVRAETETSGGPSVPTEDSGTAGATHGPAGGAEQFAAAVAEAAERLLDNCPRIIIKSQLLMGGRGKAGLIKLASTPGEAAAIATTFFASTHAVRMVLVEEAVEIQSEIYLSIAVDPEPARLVVLASAEGGVEIEDLARNKPGAIRRVGVDINRGLQPYQARSLAYNLGLSGATARQFACVLTSLYQVFSDNDAELAEINPLFVTTGGDLLAGDGKVIIDDNSLFRQTAFEHSREYFNSDAEFEAALDGIPYLQFDGDISLMCAGAGLTTTVFDLVHYEGGTIANYLEFGGPNYRKAHRAMELCLKNDSKVILIVTFGTIARADVMAQGVVDAIEELDPDRPIVTCIRGTNEEEAVRILSAAGLEPLFDTEDAVRQAVTLSARSRR